MSLSFALIKQLYVILKSNNILKRTRGFEIRDKKWERDTGLEEAGGGFLFYADSSCVSSTVAAHFNET